MGWCQLRELWLFYEDAPIQSAIRCVLAVSALGSAVSNRLTIWIADMQSNTHPVRRSTEPPVRTALNYANTVMQLVIVRPWPHLAV